MCGDDSSSARNGICPLWDQSGGFVVSEQLSLAERVCEVTRSFLFVGPCGDSHAPKLF